MYSMQRMYRMFPLGSKQDWNLYLLLRVQMIQPCSLRPLQQFTVFAIKKWITALSIQLFHRLLEDHHSVVRVLSSFRDVVAIVVNILGKRGYILPLSLFDR